MYFQSLYLADPAALLLPYLSRSVGSQTDQRDRRTYLPDMAGIIGDDPACALSHQGQGQTICPTQCCLR